MSDVAEDFVDFVGDTIETVGDVVEDTFDEVVDVVQDVGKAIGDAVETIGDALEDIEDFAKPLVERYAIQVALVAMGVPPQFAPSMSAGMHTLAKGGSPEDAIKSAATVAVIQQVGQSVQGGMEAANADAIAQNLPPVYSPAEIAAATSAASSAVATAAADGDIKQVLTSAAIGGVTGAAATEVYKATGSAAAADFARVTMQSTLQGVEIKEAILMGASSSMVTYLQTMNKYANESSNISRSRAAAVAAYKERVANYNEKLGIYNQQKERGNVTTANLYARELTEDLKIINNLADQIGSFNTQLKELSDKYVVEQEKAIQEGEKSGFDFKPKTPEMLAQELQQREEQENVLISQIQEAAQREFGDAEALQLAEYKSPIITDATQIDGEEPLRINITLDFAPGETFGDPELNMVVDENYNVVDRNTGEFLAVVPENRRKLPVTGFIDLRKYVGSDGTGSAIIGGGGTSQAGASILPFSFLGYDTATGQEKYSLFDEPFTLITLDGNKRVLSSDIGPIFLELTQTPDNQIEFKPVDVVETAPDKFETRPIEPEALELPSEKRRPGQPGGAGGTAYKEVINELTNAASRAALQAEEANSLLQDSLIKEQFFTQQSQRARQEIERLNQLLNNAKEQVKDVITTEGRAKAQQAINDISNEINRVQELTNNINRQLADAQSGAQQADIAFKFAKQSEIDAANEINRIREGRAEFSQKALLERFNKELASYEKQLADLEKKAQESTQGAKTTAEQAYFQSGQVGRLRQAGRLTGQLQTDIEQEISNLIERSQQFQTAAREASTKREGLAAPQQKVSIGKDISDKEIIDLLGLSPSEQQEFGFRAEEGEAAPGPGTAPEEGGTGAGAGTGTGLGEGDGDELPVKRFDAQGRAITTTVVERGEGDRGTTPGISSRVTGEALVGILGEKEPLFGGDEDEQRAVWNRRSLRLRKALGL